MNASLKFKTKRIVLGTLLCLNISYLASCTGGSSSSQSTQGLDLGLKIQIVSGNNQVTTPNASWAQPLIIRVVNGGQGVPAVPVSFVNALTNAPNNASVVNPLVITDQDGYARTSAVAPNVSNKTLLLDAVLGDNATHAEFSLVTRSFPDTPTMTMNDPVTLSTAYAMQTNVTVNIIDVASAVRWCLSEDQNTRPSDGLQTCIGGTGPSNGWNLSKPTNFTLSSTNGVKSLFIWVADQYNQVSLFPSSASIFLDTVAPGIPVVTLSDPGSGSNTDTSSAVVNMLITNDGDASYWCTTTIMSGDPIPANPTRSDACWNATKPVTASLVNLGQNEIFVWTKDLAGNVSPGPGTQFINWTTLTIQDPVFTMWDAGTHSTTYVRSNTVNLTITNDIGAAKYCVSETQTTRPPTSLTTCNGGQGTVNGWFTSRPTSFTLSGGDGLKTVYVWIANPLLNTDADPVSQTITVDTIAPAIPLTDLTDPNTGQPNFTNQSVVNFSITNDTDAVAWCYYEKSALATPPSLPAFGDACWNGTRPTQVTLGATGNRRVYLYTKDIAQNVSPAPAVAAITYTTTPPSSPIAVLRDPETNSSTLAKNQTVNLSINSPTGSVRWCVSETQTTKPVTGTATCTGGAGPSSGWYTSSPSTLTLSAGDGLKTAYVWVADGANNVNATSSTTAITLDLTPPATPTIAISDPNSASTTDTNQIIPNLTVTADTDAVKWCRIIQDPAVAAPATPALSDVCWVVTRPTNVILDQTGIRKLYVFTMDLAGNIGAAGTTTISYSTDVPSDPTIVLADAFTSLTTFANQTHTTLSITNDTGAARWCVSETQTTRPSLATAPCNGGLGGSNGWSLTKPNTWILSAGNGNKRIYVWTGNVSNSVNNNPSSASIVLDQTLPSTPVAGMKDPNTLSPSFTNQSTVVLNISGEDADVTAWCVLEQSVAAAAPATPAWNNACWTTTKPTTAALTAVGNRKVYVYFRDTAFNVSSTAGTASINYSTTSPALASLDLSDATTSSNTYVRQVATAVSVTGDTGAVKWCLSETQTTRPVLGTSNCLGGTGAANGWLTVRPTTFNLSIGDGAKTAYLWTSDQNNNTSATAATDTISLDTLPPSVPFVTLFDPLTSNSTVTNQNPISMSVQYDTDAVKWCVIEQSFAAAVPTQPLFSNACWVSVRPTAITLGATGMRRAFVYTQDTANNVSAAAAVAQINYTTTPPSDPSLTLTNSATGSTTISKDLVVTPSIFSPTGTIQWCLSETQTTRPTSGLDTCHGGAGPAAGWYTSLPNSFTLSAGDGLKTVYIWVADTNNNVNANLSSGTITLDTAGPATPTVALSDPNTASTTKTNQFSVNLSITADTDAVGWCTIIQASVAAAPSTPALNDSCWRSVRPTGQLIDSTGVRKLYVFTRDTAGNIGTAGTTTIDYSISPPADPTLALADATTALTDYVQSQALAIGITTDTGAVKWCISETQSTRPSLGTAACAGGTGGSNGWLTVRPTTFTLSAGEALKRVYVWTADVYNNVNSNPSSNTVTLDTTAPAVPAVAMMDPNTNSSTQTNQSTVNLNIGTTADGLAWCVFEQAVATAAPSAPAYNNACFSATKPTTQVLGATGTRKVYVYTRDRAYNVAASAGVATIAYSTSAPVTGTLALSDPTTSSASYVRQLAIADLITGDTGAVKWCISETQTTRPTYGTSTCAGGTGAASGWLVARPTTFTLSAGDGSKTVYLWTADASNNTTSTAATAAITVDTAPPAIPTVVLADPNTASTTNTNVAAASISITSDTDAVSWCILEQSAGSAAPTAPLFNNACWVGTRPTSTTLGALGSRRAYVYTRDVANNVSLAPAIASISYSTTAPADPALSLSNATTGSHTYTNTRPVQVSITNPTGAVAWCLSESQSTRPANGTTACTGGAGPSNGWYTSMPSTFTLSTTDALKTVYIWVADSSNNTNVNPTSATITLLQTPPSAPTVALSDPNTLSSVDTNQSSVNMAITADTGATAWCPIAQDSAAAAPATPSASATCWVSTRPSSVALGATGSREVYVFLRDPAMNISSAGTATMSLSTTAPADPTLALSDAVTSLTTYAKSTALNVSVGNDTGSTLWCISETQTVKPNLGTSACTGGIGSANGWLTSRPTTQTLSGGDGTKRVYIWIANAWNNVNNNPVSQPIVLDTAGPSTPTVALKDPNTLSSAYTNQSTVTLNITGEDPDVTAWCVFEQASAAAAPTAPAFGNICWTTTKPTTQVMGATGTRKVYVYFRDQADNISASAGTATINYSTTAPVTATLALSDATTASTTYVRQAATTVAVTGDTGAVKWCLSESQSTRPALATSNCTGGTGAANGWLTVRPTTMTLSTGDASKTVYLWTGDQNNNTSATAASYAITLDTLPPSVPFVTLSDPLTNSTTVTNQNPINISIQFDTDAVKWCMIEQSFVAAVPSQPAFNAGCWVGTRPTAITLGATGIRRVFVYTQDTANNVSAAAAVSQINYTTTPPSDPSLTLTNSSTGSSTISKDLAVTPSIYSPAGTIQWCLSETQTTRPTSGLDTCTGGAGPASGWYTSLPNSFTLSAGDGLKTVYIWVSDTSNNTSANVETGSITLDTVGPATPTVAVSDPNTGSTSKTNQFSANLSITADTDAVGWCPMIQASAAPAPSAPALNDSCWRSVRPTTQFIDATGVRTLYVFTRDSAGNIGTAGSGSIDYSITPPADPTLALADATTALTDFVQGQALNIGITTDTNAVKWCVSETQSTRPSLGTTACTGGAGASSGWYTVRPTTFTLSAGEALKRVYVWTADSYNNVNSNASSNTVTLDTTSPLVPTVSMMDPNTSSASQSNQATVNLNISATADALAWCVIEQASAAAAPSAPAYNNACFTTTKPTLQLLGALGARKIYVYTRDRAYNVAASAATATMTYSTTAPATATLALSDTTTSSTSYARQVSITDAITVDTGAVKWCLSETQTTKPALGTTACTGGAGSSNGWFTSRPATFSLSSGDGSKTAYLWTADAYNNTSVAAATSSITLDTLAPAIPTASMSDPNSGSNSYTNQSTVNISITLDTDAVSWCILEQSAAAAAPSAPLFSNACWAGTRPTTTSLSALGSRRAYVYTKDVAGNVSLAPSIASISYSTTPPSDPVLTLSNSVTGSHTYTNDRNVAVSINNPVGAVQWCISETQSTRPANGTTACTGGAGTSNGWYTSMPSTFQLSNGDALKTVYIWVSDASNNTNVNPSSTTINLLQTPLSAPSVAMADPNTSSATQTNQSSVNMTITSDTGATAWCPLVQDSAAAAPAAPATSSTCWVLTRPTSVSLGTTGSREVYVFLRDAAMNVSSAGTATINLSTTSPADPTLAMVHAVTGLSTYAQTTALNITIGNDALATRWCVSEAQSVKPTLGTSACTGGAGGSNGWFTARPTTQTLTTVDGTKRVYVWVANVANNVNDNPVSQTIILDTLAPAAFSISGLTGAGDTTADAFLGTTLVPTVNWAAAAGATLYNVVIKDAAGTTVVCTAASTVATSYNFSACNLVDGTSYKAYVTAQDDALNVTPATNSPFTFSVTLTPPGTFTISGITGASDITPDQWAGSSLPTVTWSTSTGVQNYYVRVLANDGVTVMCPQQVKAAGVLSHDYSTTGCAALVDNTLYQAEVVAQNVAGNTRSATNSLFVFRTDLSAPTVNITGQPAATSISNSASFTFTSADTISGVNAMDCKLDAGAYAACTTGTTQSYASLADGSHTFTVRATDKVGLTATSSYTWSIDTVAPNAFTITGATGATDLTADAQLRNDTIMTANWTTSANATSYDVTIFANDGTTVVCPTVTKPAGATSHTFTGCSITNPGNYYMSVVAKRGFGTTYDPGAKAIAAVLDTLAATITTSSGTVNSGSSVTLTLTATQNGSAVTTNVLNPTFSIASGSSTGTFGTVNYSGGGTYTVTFTGVLTGTAANITATSPYLAGFTSVSQAAVTVNVGPVSAAVSGVSLSSSTVQADNSSLITVTALVKDAAGNSITGATVSAATNGGTSTGAYSSFTEAPAGTYTANFLGHTSGSATNTRVTANATLLTSQPAITVLPGPPVKIGAAGSASITTHQCAGPYTITLRDFWNNLASAQSNVQVDMSGLTLGNFSLASDCSTNDASLNIFLGGSTAAPVYIMPRAPAASNILTFADHAATLTSGTITAAVAGTLAWLGTTGQVAFNATSGVPSRSMLDGLQQPRAVWYNDANKNMYVVDTNNHRVVRYNMTGSTMTGWVGHVDSVDSMACPGYTVPTSGGITPSWCTGGSSIVVSGTNWDGMLNSPSDITGDGTYLYVLDTANQRIVRYNEATGAFAGWYGRVNGVVGLSCPGYATPTTGLATPDWCFGGTSQASSGTVSWNGWFSLNTNAAIRSIYDPTAGSNLLMVNDAVNHRIVRLRTNTSHVIFEGWAGRYNGGTLTDGVNTTGCAGITVGQATPGWCLGGYSTLAPAPTTPTVSSYDNMFSTPRGLTVMPGSPSYAYFADVTNARFVKFNVTTGKTDYWAGRSTFEYPGTGGTNCTTYNTDSGWCSGGVPIYNGYCYPACTGNTAARNTYGVNAVNFDIDTNYIYFTYTTYVFRVPLTTVFSNANAIYWVGRINGTPTIGANCSTTPLGFTTPNWCANGSSAAGLTDGQFTTPVGLYLDTANGFIYTVDNYLSKVQITYSGTGSSAGWIGAKANSSPSSWSTSYSPGLIGNVTIKGEDLSFGAGYNLNIMGGIGSDGTNVYVTDTANSRIKRYTASNGSFQGWYGRTATLPTAGDDSCTSITAGALTPTWCFGGSSQAAANSGTGEISTPRGIAADTNYIYIADTGLHRVARISRTGASFAGWMGRNNTGTALTGFDTAGNTQCGAVPTTTFTGAFCANGNHTTSTAGDGSMNSPRGIAVDAVDSLIFVADTGNNRINLYSSANNPSIAPSAIAGTFLGWLGRVNAVTSGSGPTTGVANTVCTALTAAMTTPNWCMGGTTQAGSVATGFSGFSGPQAVSYDNGYIYVADTGNNRIHKFNALTGAYYGWIGRVTTVMPTGAATGSGLTNLQCTGTGNNNATVGWCVGGGSQVSGGVVYDGAFSSPTGIWVDPSSNFFYVVDYNNHRVTKHNKNSGAYVGWRGGVGSVSPTGGDPGCAGTATNSITPGWCTGGTAQSGRTLGAFYYPVSITGDANFIYVTDSYNNRVVALPK